jgi:uncharacterized protein
MVATSESGLAASVPMGVQTANPILGLARPVSSWRGSFLALAAEVRRVALQMALAAVFGDKKIGDVTACRLLIPTADLVQGKPWVWKTPHLKSLIRDRHYPIVDALMATTAAPTYFRPASSEKGGRFADGGVWANNPTMAAIVDAIRISSECVRERVDPCFDLKSVYVLSVGTGKATLFTKPPELGGGVVWWGARKGIELVMSTQAQGVHHQARQILGNRYHRVDFDVPDASWTLDNIHLINDLIHLGNAKGAENVAELQPVFFSERTVPYTPFGDVVPLALPM